MSGSQAWWVHKPGTALMKFIKNSTNISPESQMRHIRDDTNDGVVRVKAKDLKLR